MVKKMNISFSNWVYDTYLSKFEGNRSEFIEGMFVKGFEVSTEDFSSSKQKLISLQLEMKKLSDENNQLKSQLGLIKQKFSKHRVLSPDVQKKLMIARSIRASGIIGDLP